MDAMELTHVLAHVGLADEELRAQVIFCNYLMVCECDGAYAGEDEVFCDFVGESFDGDEQDVCVADSTRLSTDSHMPILKDAYRF